MPNLDGTGPESKGTKTGRGLGRCNHLDNANLLEKLGKGMGLRRKNGNNGKGQGRRLNSGK